MEVDPRALIEELVESGMTETEISESLRERGVDVTQATINRLKNGVHKSTSFDIGYGLMKLRDSRCEQRAVGR
jgi:hypothetical protein